MDSQDKQSREQPASSVSPCNTSNLLSAEDKATVRSYVGKWLPSAIREMSNHYKTGRLSYAPLNDLNAFIPFVMYESIERQEHIAAQMKDYLVSLQSVSFEMNGQIQVMKKESRIMVILAGLTALLTVALVVLTVILIWNA